MFYVNLLEINYSVNFIINDCLRAVIDLRSAIVSAL